MKKTILVGLLVLVSVVGIGFAKGTTSNKFQSIGTVVQVTEQEYTVTVWGYSSSYKTEASKKVWTTKLYAKSSSEAESKAIKKFKNQYPKHIYGIDASACASTNDYCTF